jgi:hypothetical protein
LIFASQPMNAYQKDQLDDMGIVQKHLEKNHGILSENYQQKLVQATEEYIIFRKNVETFLAKHFTGTCTKNCYDDRLSACCGKDSIIIFFADIVINFLFSTAEENRALIRILHQNNTTFKCIYLDREKGCRWKIKPIICAMFLCPKAQKKSIPGE